MMYPFLTLDDGMKIVHSQTMEASFVKVNLEKSDEKDSFCHATCFLSEYRWGRCFHFRYRDSKTSGDYTRSIPFCAGVSFAL